MLFGYGYGQQQIGDNKKCRRNAGDFACDKDVVVQCGLHRPMKHAQGFTRSHWMLPLGKCVWIIASVAVMVDKFVETTLNTNKTQLLPSNYGTF